MPLMLTTAAAVIAALFPLFVAHQFGDEGRMVRDSILALQFALGVYLAAYVASGSMSRELRTGTGLMILSKAVARHTFFLAKFAGVVAIVCFFSVCVWIAAILSTRVGPGNYMVDERAAGVVIAAVAGAYALAGLINCVYRRPFCSTACGLLAGALPAALAVVARWPGEGAVEAMPVLEAARQLGPAVMLIGMGIVAMAAIALSLAARLSLVPVLSLCVGMFLAGLVSDHMHSQMAGVPGLAAILHATLPNWQHFWVADALMGGAGIPGSYLLTSAVYAVLYTGGVLCAGAAAFACREVK